MATFRRHTPKKQSHTSVDGFIPNTSNIDAPPPRHKKQPVQHLQPEEPTSNTDLNVIADAAEEDFTPTSTSLDTFQAPGGRSYDLTAPRGADGPIQRRFGRQSKKKRGLRRRIFKTFAVLVVAFVVAVSSIFGYTFLKTRQIFRGNGESAAAFDENVDPARLNGEGDGRINILLLGKGGPGHVAPDLTDTLLLASIDPVQNEAALLSVPRDMYVRDQNGSSTKINAVYANAKSAVLNAENANEDAAEDAGLQAIKQTVTDVLGVPVHYYVMVNFKAFEDAINIVGGVDVYAEEELRDQSVAWLLGGNSLLATEGLNTFDGTRALLYARSRKGSARGDFDRTQRQRELIVALQQKVLSVSTFANPLKVIDLLNTFGDNVRTDLNGLDEIKRLYEIGQGIGEDSIVSVGLADDPILVVTDFTNGLSVVRPIEGFYQYDDIHSFVRNTMRDARLKQEDSRVVILNGTDTSGLASAKQRELESFGYNVVSVGDAPTDDYGTTRLIGLNPEHRYTESFLMRRLGVSVEETAIEGVPTAETADFVIILGSDEAINTTSTN